MVEKLRYPLMVLNMSTPINPQRPEVSHQPAAEESKTEAEGTKHLPANALKAPFEATKLHDRLTDTRQLAIGHMQGAVSNLSKAGTRLRSILKPLLIDDISEVRAADERLLVVNKIFTWCENSILVCGKPRFPEIQPVFWGVIRDHSVTDIVNINPANEPYASNYFPANEKKITCGHYVIHGMNRFDTIEASLNIQGYTQKCRISAPGEKDSYVNIHKIEDWEDQQGYPCSKLIDLARALLEKPQVLIHCRAGMGRTGTMVIAMKLVQLFNNGLLTKNKSVSKLCQLVLLTRAERGNSDEFWFVSTGPQFETLLQLLQMFFGLKADEIDRIIDEYEKTLPDR